jgi:hypothetical protein
MIIASGVGDNTGPISVVLESLPMRRVTAIVSPSSDGGLDQVRALLSQKGIQLQEFRLGTTFVNEFFTALREIKLKQAEEEILVVNVSAGATPYSYYLLCGAMAAGVMAFAVERREIVFLPISCSITHGS